MRLTGNTIFDNRGVGIGLGLTGKTIFGSRERSDHCGRRPDKLMEVKERYPGVHTKVCDVANELSRRELYNWVTGTFPALRLVQYLV